MQIMYTTNKLVKKLNWKSCFDNSKWNKTQNNFLNDDRILLCVLKRAEKAKKFVIASQQAQALTEITKNGKSIVVVTFVGHHSEAVISVLEFCVRASVCAIFLVLCFLCQWCIFFWCVPFRFFCSWAGAAIFLVPLFFLRWPHFHAISIAKYLYSEPLKFWKYFKQKAKKLSIDWACVCKFYRVFLTLCWSI